MKRRGRRRRGKKKARQAQLHNLFKKLNLRGVSNFEINFISKQIKNLKICPKLSKKLLLSKSSPKKVERAKGDFK